MSTHTAPWCLKNRTEAMNSVRREAAARDLLEQLDTRVTPDTLLRWHRRNVATS